MYQRPLTLSNHLSFRILKAPGFYACCLQAQCRDLYIFTSSIAKKKDTGASSYKVDSNMGILGFFLWDQISINQTYPFKVLQGTRFGTPGQNHESLTLPKHQFCFGRYQIVGNKDIYPFHHTVSVAHSFTLWLWVSQTTILLQSQQSKPTHCVWVLKMASQRPVWVTACALREWQCLRCHKAQAIHRETQA